MIGLVSLLGGPVPRRLKLRFVLKHPRSHTHYRHGLLNPNEAAAMALLHGE